MEIISIENVENTYEYVYDIETEEGTYLAGDDILVKNTDSCFIKFDVDKGKFTGLDGSFDENKFMKEQFRLAQECSEYITKQFKNPIKLEFEKIMFPFFLYEKKRYAYMEWKNPDKPNENLEYKGIATIRRDYCPYVKEVCNHIFEILMKNKTKESIDNAIIYTKESISDLFNNKVPINKLLISKSLKELYKCNGRDIKWCNGICSIHDYEKLENTPCKECKLCKDNKECSKCKNGFDFVKMPHVYLARKIREKDPINGPKPPDRIPYIFVKNKNATHQCDRVISPDSLKNIDDIDSMYYFEHQLKEPIIQIFNLMTQNVNDIYDELLKLKINKDKNQTQLTSFFKKI